MRSWLTLLIFFTTFSRSWGLAFERFEENGRVGIRDDQGHVVVPAAFEALGWSDGSFSMLGEITGYRKGTRWGLLNLKKEFITKADYLTLTSAGGNYVRVSREISAVATKVGCIDLKGEVVIPFLYDDLVLRDLRAIVMVKDGVRYKYGLVDLSHRTLLATDYSAITSLGTLRYAVRNFEGKTALFAEDGKWVTGFDIDSLSQFHYDLAILYKGLRRGVIDRNGLVRIDPLYREVRILETAVKVRMPDKWKIVDHQQHVQRQTEADGISPIGVNRFRLTLNGKSGIVDSLFNFLIPVAHDYIGPVQNDTFVVGDEDRYGLMRINGSLVLPIRFDSLIREGHLLRVRTLDFGRASWDLYDTVGVRKTLTSYDGMNASVSGLYPVFQKGYAGAVDRLGNERIACVYDSLLKFGENQIVVKFKGQYGMITHEDIWKLAPQANHICPVSTDRYLEFRGTLKTVKDFTGKVIYFTDNPLIVQGDHFLEKLPDGTEKMVSFEGVEIVRRQAPTETPAQAAEHEGLTVVKRDGKYGFVDSQGRLRIANRYEAAGNFKEGLASVRILGKWGFIDKTDQIVVQPAYDRQSTLEQGVAVVTRGGRFGIIDREGNVRLELRYDSIRRADSSTFVLFQNGSQGLADGDGRILLEPRFDSILPIENDQVIVSQGGRYGVLTRDGLSVFPLRYELLIYQPTTKTFLVRETFAWESRAIK